MIKELEALEVLKGIDIIIDGCAWNYKDTDYKENFEIIEKALTELEELKRDVKRFMELKNNITNREEMDEFWEIDNKLSKVGNEE